MIITITANDNGYVLSYDRSHSQNATIIINKVTPENIDDLLAQIRATVINNIPAKSTTDNG